MKRLADVAIAVVLAAVGAGIAWQGSARTAAALQTQAAPPGGYDDIWFDSDTGDVYRRLTVANQEQDHTVRHPLVPLLMRAPMRLYLRLAPPADPYRVVRFGLALVAAGWAALMFATLRRLGCRGADALLVTLLGLASAASLHWFVVADTFAFGSLTILASVLLIAMAARHTNGELISASAVAVGASVTVTNAAVGAIGAMARHPRRRAIQAIANGACMVLVLWGAQRLIYPTSEFPYGYGRSYRVFLFSSDTGAPVWPLLSAISHTMVMPEVGTAWKGTQENYPELSVQRAMPGSSGVAGAAATVAWLALLGLGLASLSRAYEPGVRAAVAGGLAVQLALHVVFGGETFLFAMHFLPLLLIVAAAGTLARYRTATLVVACVLLVLCTLNNTQQFSRSVAIAAGIRTGVTP